MAAAKNGGGVTELGHDPRGEIPSSRTTSSAVAAAAAITSWGGQEKEQEAERPSICGHVV